MYYIFSPHPQRQVTSDKDKKKKIACSSTLFASFPAVGWCFCGNGAEKLIGDHTRVLDWAVTHGRKSSGHGAHSHMTYKFRQENEIFMRIMQNSNKYIIFFPSIFAHLELFVFLNNKLNVKANHYLLTWRREARWNSLHSHFIHRILW